MERPAERILVVDDDADTRALLVEVLGSDGYEVHPCAAGEQALEILERREFDLVIADIRLPRMSGLDLLLEVRRSAIKTKVILMTAYASLQSVIEALRGDADDYITKPFRLPELRRQVRRAIAAQTPGGRPPQADEPRGVVRYGDLAINYDARRVRRGEADIGLTRLEFDVLAYLAWRQGCAVSYDELLREVWGYDQPDLSSHPTVKSCIFRIRAKIGDDGHQPRYVLNVRGVGYRLGV